MTIALDGSPHGNFNAISGSVALTTAIDADEILVAVAIANGSTQTVASVTSDKGVLFAKRTAKPNGTSVNLETWYGGWGSHGTINITVTLSASAKFTVNIDSISGLPAQAAIFDANAACPKDVTGTGTAVTTGTTGATTSAADFGYCAVAIVGNASQSLTKGNVYGTAATAAISDNTGTTAADVYGGLEYLVLAAAKTNLAGTWTAGSSQAYSIILDAIVGYASTEAAAATSAGTATGALIASSLTATEGAGAALASQTASSITASNAAGAASASPLASSIAASTGAGQSAASSIASSLAAASSAGQASAIASSINNATTSALAMGAAAASAVMTNPVTPVTPTGLTNDDDETMASEVKIRPWWAERPPQWATWQRSTSIELHGSRKVSQSWRRTRIEGSRSVRSSSKTAIGAARTLRSSTGVVASKTLTASATTKVYCGKSFTASYDLTMEAQRRYKLLMDSLIATGVFD